MAAQHPHLNDELGAATTHDTVSGSQPPEFPLTRYSPLGAEISRAETEASPSWFVRRHHSADTVGVLRTLTACRAMNSPSRSTSKGPWNVENLYTGFFFERNPQVVPVHEQIDVCHHVIAGPCSRMGTIAAIGE